MKRFGFSILQTISCYSIVEAENEEEAIRLVEEGEWEEQENSCETQGFEILEMEELED